VALDLDAQQRCLIWLQRGQVIGLMQIECAAPADPGGALELTRKYRDQPMDFAIRSVGCGQRREQTRAT
jgi:hypothetical protein